MARHVHAPMQDADDVDTGGDLSVEDHVCAARVLPMTAADGASSSSTTWI
jgi:hypothetical protein